MSHLSYTDSTSVARPPSWQQQGECASGYDPELFFPIGNTGPAVHQIEEAKDACRRCDVVDTCLRWALDTGQDAGVWGGLSEDERRSMKRRNARGRRTLGGQRLGEPAAPPHKAHSELVDSAAAAAAVRAATDHLSIRKIATLTNVSQSTIQSLATGQREQVLDETSERILAALAEPTMADA